MKEHNDAGKLCKEYSLDDFPGGLECGKYSERMAEGSYIVRLDPDVAHAFPDSTSDNEALRSPLVIAKRTCALIKSSSGRSQTRATELRVRLSYIPGAIRG